MLALTLLRPWEASILHLGKDIENRKWKPTERVRGQRIALHAGKGWDGDGAAFIISQGPKPDAEYQKWLDRIEASAISNGGFIVGTVRIVDWFERGDLLVPPSMAQSPWFFGPWGWRLADVFALPEPVPCKGALSLWRLPPDIETRVVAQEAQR